MTRRALAVIRKEPLAITKGMRYDKESAQHTIGRQSVVKRKEPRIIKNGVIKAPLQ